MQAQITQTARFHYKLELTAAQNRTQGNRGANFE